MMEPDSLELQTARKAHDNLRSQFMTLNQSVMSSGQGAIQNLFLMHGGALIAMLTFIGGLLQKENPAVSTSSIMKPMIWFAFGLAFATLGSVGTYATNYCHAARLSAQELTWVHPFVHETKASKSWSILGNVLHISTVVVALLSLALFVIGFWSVRNALLQ